MLAQSIIVFDVIKYIRCYKMSLNDLWCLKTEFIDKYAQTIRYLLLIPQKYTSDISHDVWCHQRTTEDTGCNFKTYDVLIMNKFTKSFYNIVSADLQYILWFHSLYLTSSYVLNWTHLFILLDFQYYKLNKSDENDCWICLWTNSLKCEKFKLKT